MSAAGPGTATQHRDVVIIGGGQAGLAIGYFLAELGRRFTILEAASGPAAAWRTRWDSLKLFTPVRYDSLPGLAFPGDLDSYPGRDDVVAYLTDYARHFELPVEYDSRVRAVRARDDRFVVDLGDRTYEADQVVVATGPFQEPFVPSFSERSTPASSSCTAAATARRLTSPTGLCWSSEAATPASRSPRSSPGRARSISRSARARPRSRSESPAVTFSATSRRPA